MGIFPWFPDLPSSYLEQDPIRVHTNQPHLLGGSSTSYDKDHYPINFNYTFRGLTDDLPVCFNFPPSHTKSFIIPTKNGCIGAFKKAILTDSPTSKFTYKKGDWSVWILQARMPRVLDPYKSLFFNAPRKYPNCIDVAPLDIVGKTIDHHLGYPPWKSCTYNSRTDYIILGGGNYSAQDWSNPNPSQDPKSVHGYTTKFSIGKIIPSHGHWQPTDGTIINLFPPCCPIQLRARPFGNQKFGKPLLPPLLSPYPGQKTILPILYLPAYPPLTLFYALTTPKGFIYRWTTQEDRI